MQAYPPTYDLQEIPLRIANSTRFSGVPGSNKVRHLSTFDLVLSLCDFARHALALSFWGIHIIGRSLCIPDFTPF